MNDRKMLIKDFAIHKLKKGILYLIISLLLLSLFFFGIDFVRVIIDTVGKQWLYLIDLLYIFLLLIPGILLLAVAIIYCSFYFTGKAFIRNHLEMEKIYFPFDGYESILKTVREYCYENGYCYERYLNTLIYNEDFTVFTKIDTTKTVDFPVEKIAVYRCEQYSAEYEPAFKQYKVCNSDFGEAKQFKKMFCDNGLHKYGDNSEYVNINSIIIVIVDRMNRTLYRVLSGEYKEKYALFAVICLENPNEIFISKDNRWIGGQDYSDKREELFKILNINLW